MNPIQFSRVTMVCDRFPGGVKIERVADTKPKHIAMTEPIPMTNPKLLKAKQTATKTLENLVKKEAFLHTLTTSLTTLTTDITLGRRFISTTDYDGNLYECKQVPYEVLLSLPMEDEDGKIMAQEHTSELSSVDLSARMFPIGPEFAQSMTPFPLIQMRDGYGGTRATYVAMDNPVVQQLEIDDDTFADMIDDTIHITDENQLLTIAPSNPWQARQGIANLLNTKRGIDFTITAVESESYLDDNGVTYTNYRGLGYFPAYQRMAERIWVRKCNLIGEAFGKNIDSSRKSIVFTLEDMSLKDMLHTELMNLTKVRKVFELGYPTRCRSRSLKSVKEEHERLKPVLDRLIALYDGLTTSDIVVKAYWTKKYGFLIPVSAEMTVATTTPVKSLTHTLSEATTQAVATVEAHVQLRKDVAQEVIPYALHPDRVAKAVELHTVEGVFGDDVVIARNLQEGKVGVVNTSVFG